MLEGPQVSLSSISSLWVDLMISLTEDQTDFDKSFLAFNVAKNVEVAPVNQCIASSSSVKKEVSAVKINSLAEITLKGSH